MTQPTRSDGGILRPPDPRMESMRALDLPPELLSSFCTRHHIARLALFGSVLRMSDEIRASATDRRID